VRKINYITEEAMEESDDRTTIREYRPIYIVYKLFLYMIRR
jgi:hypothetical protein